MLRRHDHPGLRLVVKSRVRSRLVRWNDEGKARAHKYEGHEVHQGPTFVFLRARLPRPCAGVVVNLLFLAER